MRRKKAIGKPLGATRKRIYRRVNYTIDPDTGYWNYGLMISDCQFCSALHYRREKNGQKESTSRKAKFSGCRSGEQVILHLFLTSSCVQYSNPYQNEEDCDRHRNPGKNAVHADTLCRKSFQRFSSLPNYFESCWLPIQQEENISLRIFVSTTVLRRWLQRELSLSLHQS